MSNDVVEIKKADKSLNTPLGNQIIEGDIYISIGGICPIGVHEVSIYKKRLNSLETYEQEEKMGENFELRRTGLGNQECRVCGDDIDKRSYSLRMHNASIHLDCIEELLDKMDIDDEELNKNIIDNLNN